MKKGGKVVLGLYPPEGPPEEEALRDVMANLSQDMYSAGWHDELEFRLWARMAKEPVDERSYDPADFLKLSLLSARVEGWVEWSDELGCLFITLDEWQPKYAAWRQAWREKYETEPDGQAQG